MTRPDDLTRQTLQRLHDWFAQAGSALVAYSGGVDSALLAVVARRALQEKALACIGISPSYPQRELNDALALAKENDIAVELVNTQEHLDPRYAANPQNRCYFCKNELYDRLVPIARERGFAVVVDGTNASDLGDDRPGRTAAREHMVRSPLVELEIDKPMIRQLAQALNLKVWDKPAMACLSSRVPHGTEVTPELLRQIERAEDALIAMGFRQMRVRHHGEVARVEVPADDLARALELRQRIVRELRAAGYRHVALDLAGFRGGADPELVQLKVRSGT